MTRPLALAAALLAASPAAAFEKLGVLAVAEPPGGPDVDLAELAHHVRSACRERVGGVEDVPSMRARLLGHRSSATLTELDRAYGGALAVYQNGEFQSAIRTLKAIIDDLESLPETDEAYAQWVRAQLRLAHAALTIGRERDADEAMRAAARTDASIQPDPDQFSPSYRRRFEQVKAKVRALPSRRLHVRAEGSQGTVFVNGRAMGSTPLVLSLAAGVYRVGGASGALHVPSFRVDLEAEDRGVVLDFGLAEGLRPHAGPGLALPVSRRSDGVVRAGAWLGVDRVIAVSRAAEGDAQFLLGSIYDVRNGALLREGSVRMVAGSVPAANIGALAAFLLTGQSSRDVKDRTVVARDRVASSAAPESRAVAAAPVPDRASDPLASTPRAIVPSLLPRLDTSPASGATGRRWLRPAAYGSAVLVGVFAGLAIHQGIAAKDASSGADRMLSADGVLAAGADPSRYHSLRDDARVASRNAYVSGGAAVVFALTAGALGWKSFVPERGAELALRF
jgi:hypothetical protein